MVVWSAVAVSIATILFPFIVGHVFHKKLYQKQYVKYLTELKLKDKVNVYQLQLNKINAYLHSMIKKERAQQSRITSVSKVSRLTVEDHAEYA